METGSTQVIFTDEDILVALTIHNEYEHYWNGAWCDYNDMDVLNLINPIFEK